MNKKKKIGKKPISWVFVVPILHWNQIKANIMALINYLTQGFFLETFLFFSLNENQETIFRFKKKY